MAKEPIFNVDEPTPMRLAGVFILIHLIVTYSPAFISNFAYQWGLLIPMSRPEALPLRQFTSLFGHGLLHGGWTHVLVNAGMTVAFGIITFRGLRAIREKPQTENVIPLKTTPKYAESKFWIIFLGGVVLGGLVQWFVWGVMGISNVSALGASGGASALFATAGYAMGGRRQMLGFGFAWALINVILVVAKPLFGGIAWAAHMGGFLAGAFMAPYWIKPFSSGASITR